jgi:AcrR family transcriptional regulator
MSRSRPASTPERTPTKAAQTRRRILDAAAKVFRERGFVATRLSDIAAEAGMQAGSLYYHFESREALVEAVMWAGQERTEAEVRRRLAALGPDATPIARLGTAIEAHLLALLTSTDANLATIKLIGQVPGDLRERLLAGQRAYGDLWRNLLGDARSAGELPAGVDLSILRMTVLGALNWSVEWYDPTKGSPEAMASAMTAVLLDGLRRRNG